VAPALDTPPAGAGSAIRAAPTSDGNGGSDAAVEAPGAAAVGATITTAGAGASAGAGDAAADY